MRRRRKNRVFAIKLPTKGLGAFVSLFVGFAGGYGYHQSQTPVLFDSTASNPSLRVCFSPEGRCEKVVLKAIHSAQSQILVQAYALTSKPIVEALIEAKNRNVSVHVLCDESQSRTPYSRVAQLKKGGISVEIDPVGGLAHNKVMVIDEKVLLTGSYNWTNAANTKNAENLLVIEDQKMIQIFKENWMRRAGKL